MEYRVIRSRRRTLCLSVEQNGEILVRAPIGIGDREIENFVIRHKRWIDSRSVTASSRRKLSLEDGETLILFGSRYAIETGKARILNGVLFLPSVGREKAFSEILKRFAAEKMSECVKDISRRYGFEYSRIRISSARTRWGSCSKKGVLSFTCFLAFVDPELAEYVAVHELCHTRYFHHGKDFWLEVENILPDWRAKRARLRKEEECLNYLR